MAGLRSAAVAGTFYPDDPRALRSAVEGYLADAAGESGPNPAPAPKAIIAPHAGYIYSGPAAASAYARLAPVRASITRVVVIGPSHRVGFSGFALPAAEAFETPLGIVKIDREAIGALARLPDVAIRDDAHGMEHCLEVQLPFLQTVLEEFAIVPAIAGEATAEQVADILEVVWGGPETLIVISSDLSHHRDYETARRMDAATSSAIETLHADGIDYEGACGRVPIIGLLSLARQKGLKVETLDVRNSGDTAGPSDSVVGYGAYALV